jgi:3-mercaptopyruvate sulfurtransferase SseA
MRKTAVVMAAAMLAATIAGAQMKPAAPPAPRGPLSSPKAAPTPESVRRISVKDALQLVKEDKAVIVDVRSFEQFTIGHIKGAYSIPGSQLVARLRELPPRKMIIAYCA